MESNDINPGRTVSLQFLWCGDTFFEYLSPFDFLYCDIKANIAILVFLDRFQTKAFVVCFPSYYLLTSFI